MPVLSLPESLDRLKSKWKQRLRLASKKPSPACSSTHDRTANPASSGPESAQNVGASEPLSISSSTKVSSTEKKNAVWPVMRSLLTTLERSAEAVGPLKAAIGGLNRCVDVFESACNGRKEYEELRVKIEGLLADLAKHMDPPMDLAITSSVKRICTDINEELRNMEETQARSTGRRLIDAVERSDEILECYSRVHGHLERLTLNATMDILKLANKQSMTIREAQLAGLLPSKSAIYNSAEASDLKRGSCTPGTREPQIKLLLDWAANPESGSTCWMNGMAGTGKTTIAYTVCAELHKTHELGASFFCSRTIPECRQVKYIIPSIAYQLARFSLPFRCALVKILESDPDAHALEPRVQYQKLIVEPLQAVLKSLPTDFIVVIDALDECENESSIGHVLDLLVSATSTLPIRFLVSSRPEPEICRRMMDKLNKPSDPLLVLHNLDSGSVKADIETYMRRELGHIPLTDDQWAGLTEQCGVLFIYASTTCRYIEQAHGLDILDEALNHILASGEVSTEHRGGEAIDVLYCTILNAAFQRFTAWPRIKNRMQALLETVICALEPIGLDTLASLLGLGSGKEVDGLIRPLRSVLNVTAATGLVTTLHASFPDFMLSASRAGSFHCRHTMRHVQVAKSCLRIIDGVEPKLNICGLGSSYLLDEEVENLDERVSQTVLPGIIYACQYWSTHLALGEYQDGLIDLVDSFFSSNLLAWLEILNLTKRKRYGASSIQKAEMWCSVSAESAARSVYEPDSEKKHAASSDVTKLAQDAWQFISVFASNPVSQSTPHIYVSMLPFWPASRPITRAYRPRTVGMLRPAGTAITGRRLALLATWDAASLRTPNYWMSISGDGTRLAATTRNGFLVLDTITGESIYSPSETDTVLSGAMSADGTRVTFACRSGAVKLWDPRNGDQVTQLLPSQGFDSDISSIVVSSDLGRVAFGLESGDIYIHSLVHKECVLGPLKGHTRYVSSIAFSPGGAYLASGSADQTLRIWDTTTGHMVGNALEGHTNSVLSLSYSPDGSRLASASYDGTISVWNPKTGQTVLGSIKGHSSCVRSVAFSPNGQFIASGSWDNTIRVYNAQTGQTVLGPLNGHTDWVWSVIFSPDNSRLFSRSSDFTIRVWNVQDLHDPNVPQSSSSLSCAILCVQYSHGGSRVVSGSEDGTIQVWDVQTCNMILRPLRAHTSAILSVDYSPNDTYIASASKDSTLRIWDALNGNDIHGAIKGHAKAVICVRFSPDSSVLASGSYDGTVRIWDVTSGQQVMTLLEGDSSIRSIGFSPDGRQLVYGSSNNTLQVLDRQTGESVIGPLQAHSDMITSVEFSPDRLQILSSSYDDTIQIWDIQPRQQTLIRHGRPLKHDGWVRSASFSPDGRFIVSGCGDGTVQVWDTETGRLILGPLEGHTRSVYCVQFSPDGSHVVSCSNDGIRFWDVSSCRDQPQGSLGRDDGNIASTTASLDNTPDAWPLDKDGWVVDQQKRRLVWVPSDLRDCERLPPSNKSAIIKKPWLKLEFNGALLGEEWTGCYQP